MMRKKTHDYLSVLRSRMGSHVSYLSNLELTASSRFTPLSYASPVVCTISRKQLSHSELGSLQPNYRSSGSTRRVATVSFMINGKVAEMDYYHREHDTPISAKLRLETLIIAAGDLKKMGCDDVLTHVFIPGRTGAAGKDAPVMMNIDDWVAYLHAYKSPNEFAAQSPL